jgi:hypothetical protein
MQMAALYAGHADFDPPQLVAELVAEANAAAARSLHRRRPAQARQWEDTWALQRREDAIDAQVVAEADARSGNRHLGAAARTWRGRPARKRPGQRKAIEVGPIPVPPKYQSKDFLKADFWRLRGGLDVPKERWVSYPGCERGADGSLPIAWAGWNHLQQATAWPPTTSR